jgi:glutathione S-transferase
MPDLILHHFETSPFGEKIRLVLGYKQLAWKSVLIPPILPKPDVVALTGGYRRTPVLQVGADIFCDTALICDVLEHVQPAPSLYPEPAKGLARILAQWADTTLFWTLIAGPKPAAHMYAGMPDAAQAFMQDREAMFGGMVRPRAPDAHAAIKSYLRRLNNLLQDQPWIAGASTSVADFAVYHSLWFTRLRTPAEQDVLLHLPELAGWMDRMQAMGHGRREAFDAGQAIAVAAAAEPAGPGSGLLQDSVFQDDHGIALGTPVSIRAESFGAETTEGTLVAATRTHVSLRRVDKRAGVVHVHFPRIGYVMGRA